MLSTINRLILCKKDSKLMVCLMPQNSQRLSFLGSRVHYVGADFLLSREYKNTIRSAISSDLVKIMRE